MVSHSLIVKDVTTVPEALEEGILYVSDVYQLAIHKCCCGCGNQTVTPLGPDGWVLTREEGAVSLQPSIGNYRFECRSHYWIKNNKVEWC